MMRVYCRAFQFVLRLAMPFLPWRRPAILHHFEELAAVIRSNGIDRVLIVTDERLSQLGLYDGLTRSLDDRKIIYTIYDGVQPNPTIENIEQALALYKEANCSGIIAFGGGSPIDCAKAVGARVVRPQKSIRQMRGLLAIRKRLPFFAAIPTTAGTGSETTVAAVVADSARQEKFVISDPSLIPHYAILEPELIRGLPPAITAQTGMDALVHAVEAFIGGSNTKQTKKDALEAVTLIFGNLYKTYCDGGDIRARENMQHAAFLAGAAFTRAYVGNIHAIAHSLGGQYGTPHGLANAVIMPHVLSAYGGKVDRQLSILAQAANIAKPGAPDHENAKAFIAAVRELNAKMGIPEKLSELKQEDIPVLTRHALREANPLYPVPVIFDKEDMARIYYSLLT